HAGDDAEDRVDDRPGTGAVLVQKRQRHDAVDDPADADEEDGDEGEGGGGLLEVEEGDDAGGDIEQTENDVTCTRPAALTPGEDAEADVNNTGDDQIAGD